jgi:penicillin amidase
LRRAATRSLAALSPRMQTVLDAYTEGVNAFARANPLPPEYGALELTHFEPWTALDSVVVARLIAFQRSFDLDITSTVTLLTYQQAGLALGFDGGALYFEDLYRVAPFDRTATLSAAGSTENVLHRNPVSTPHLAPSSDLTLKLCREYLRQIEQLQIFQDVLDRDKHAGSNEWVVDGEHTTSGFPMLANDTHLLLGAPSLFYPIHLRGGRINAAGSSVPGVPCIILGQNEKITWGATVSYADVTDTFQERIVPDADSPSGLSIVHQGQKEPVIPIPEVFRKNNFDGIPDNLVVVPPGGGIPPVTLIVPRRNNGPILALDTANGTALSVQYTGFSPTRELETFLAWNEAEGLDDFRRGLEFFDVGSINWAYADTRGNIGFFSSSEIPIREDLQAGQVQGLPPSFIRNGTGGNEWLPVQQPQSAQAVPYEILPFSEMPHIVNPPAGWLVNANNDPFAHTFDNHPLNQSRPGGGIFYLGSFYEGYRAGRIEEIIRQKLSGGKISFEDMQSIQSDTALIDAEVLVPHILQAFANAESSTEPMLVGLATNTALAEAVQRLSLWDFTTPTGVPEGHDASDARSVSSAPASGEIDASVAATIYAVWRGQFIGKTVDAPLAPFGLPLADDQHALAALRTLLENYSSQGGMGASGINFFNVPGIASAVDRRDYLILKSLSDALELLAGDAFAAAFAHSKKLDDYCWGKLHRIVFKHPLGGPFNLPPAAGLWPSPMPELAGLSVDGGFGTVDVGNAIGGVRADSADEFMFDHGAAHRWVAEATPAGVIAVIGIPGGTSGALNGATYFNLLPGWLANDGTPLSLRTSDLRREAISISRFLPEHSGGRTEGLQNGREPARKPRLP